MVAAKRPLEQMTLLRVMLTLAEARVDRYILRDFRDEIVASSNCSACVQATISSKATKNDNFVVVSHFYDTL